MITFNGIDLTQYVTISDIRRDIAPPKNLIMQQVTGRKGSYLTRVETLHRQVEVDVIFKEKELSQLRKKVRIFSGIINTDEVKKIVFHDEPDVYYYGILTDETPLKEILAFGKSTITFILPDPIAWGATQEKVLNVYSNSVTFERNSTAYTKKYQLVNENIARYEDGSVGKAIMIEEGTTNIIPNANLLSEYTLEVLNIGQQNSVIANGIATVDFTRNGTINGDCRLQSPILIPSKNTRHLYSFDIKHTSGDIKLYAIGDAVDDFTEAQKPIGVLKSDGTFTGNYGVSLHSVEVLEDGFKRFTIFFPSNFFTAGSGTTMQIYHKHGWDDLTPVSYQFRKPQLEIGKKFPTSFTDGTRQGEKLEIPTGFNIKHNSGTWEHRFFVNEALSSPANTDDKYIWNIKTTNNTNAFSLVANAGKFKLLVGTITHDITLREGWNDVSVSWGDNLIVVVNGVPILSTAYSIPSNLGRSIYIGGSNIGQQSNTIHDCIRMSNIAKSEQQLISDYDIVWSVETNTSVLMSFDGTIAIESGDYKQTNTFEVDGTYNPSPVFTIVTGNQTNEFKITLNTGEFLRVQTAINPYDVIVIDCNKNLVTINGKRALEHLDINSLFFDLNLGINSITLTEGLNAEVTVNYIERWG